MQFFRRSMLQVMVSGALCSALPSIAFAQTQKLAPEYDVIVIGSGFAGLAAAISAAENGAKVAVLEKMQVCRRQLFSLRRHDGYSWLLRPERTRHRRFTG